MMLLKCNGVEAAWRCGGLIDNDRLDHPEKPRDDGLNLATFARLIFASGQTVCVKSEKSFSQYDV